MSEYDAVAVGTVVAFFVLVAVIIASGVAASRRRVPARTVWWFVLISLGAAVVLSGGFGAWFVIAGGFEKYLVSDGDHWGAALIGLGLGAVGALILGSLPVGFAAVAGAVIVRATPDLAIRAATVFFAGAVGTACGILLSFVWVGLPVAIGAPLGIGLLLAISSISPWPAGFARRRTVEVAVDTAE